jgi:hypothetical protein
VTWQLDFRHLNLLSGFKQPDCSGLLRCTIHRRVQKYSASHTAS